VAQSVMHRFEPRAVHEGFVVVWVALGQFLHRLATSVFPLHHFRLATALSVRGSNAGCGKIFYTCPDRLWDLLNFLFNGYRFSLSGIKQPGHDVEHPLLPTAEVKERLKLYLFSDFMKYYRVNFVVIFSLMLRTYTNISLIC